MNAKVKRLAQLHIAIACTALTACQTVTPLTWEIPSGAQTMNVNGYPLAYSSRGNGPTIVFVGGVLTDYRVWSRTTASWESDYRIVAVSPRHFFPEKWTGSGSDFSVEQHAKDLDAFIEKLGGPVYLVGWSYGAHVSYLAARARPDLVKKLVLDEAPLDSLLAAPDADANAIRIQRAKETAKYFEANDMDGGLRFALDAISGPGEFDRAPPPIKQMLRDNAWTVVGIGSEDAPRVTCAEFGSLPMPTLLIQGEITTERFHQLIAEEARCLPSAAVVTIPQAGHPSPLANPPAFKSAVIEFLQK